MNTFTDEQARKFARWLSAEPRDSSAWLHYRRRVEAKGKTLSDATAELAALGFEIETGQAERLGHGGSCVVYWIDSNRRTLRRALANRRVVELNFDDARIGRRRIRTVRRGRVV